MIEAGVVSTGVPAGVRGFDSKPVVGSTARKLKQGGCSCVLLNHVGEMVLIAQYNADGQTVQIDGRWFTQCLSQYVTRSTRFDRVD